MPGEPLGSPDSEPFKRNRLATSRWTAPSRKQDLAFEAIKLGEAALGLQHGNLRVDEESKAARHNRRDSTCVSSIENLTKGWLDWETGIRQTRIRGWVSLW